MGTTISRRAFLTGAVAGGAVGVVATSGVIAVAGGALPQAPGLPGAPARPSGEPVDAQLITLNVNGKDYEVYAKANKTLLEALRQDLGLTGTKLGCNYSECSACTVLVDGVAINSCSSLAVREQGKKIITIEGMEKDGKLHPVQQAFWDHMGFQCGFCTPGQIMRTVALLNRAPNPSDDLIRRELSGNLCKCGAYAFIFAAVKDAATKMKSA
ncbi:MAG: (2Fe-2S)-binding protein [Chloroflexi bacterium]|nr:(2Fe-2S)-binding protein [Chloroflexota bacterium]